MSTARRPTILARFVLRFGARLKTWGRVLWGLSVLLPVLALYAASLPGPFWVLTAAVGMLHGVRHAHRLARVHVRTGASPVMPTPPAVLAMCEELCARFGLRRSRLHVAVVHLGEGAARDVPLAAARMGRGGAVVLVDDDLARMAATHGVGSLEYRSCYAVLAHELAHIVARDSRVTLAAVVVEHVTVALALTALCMAFLDHRPLLAAITLFAAVLVVLWSRWVSRSVEYGADALAARISGEPAVLALFLERFFPRELAPWRRALSTHPSTSRRTRRLRTH